MCPGRRHGTVRREVLAHEQMVGGYACQADPVNA